MTTMRRQTLVASVVTALVGVVVLGLPLAWSGSRLLREEAVRQLDRQASAIGLLVDDAVDQHRPLPQSALNRLAAQDRYVVVDLPGGGQQVAGVRPRRQLGVQIATASGAEVRVAMDRADVERRERTAWLVVFVLSATGVLVAVAVALAQARRLVRPLVSLAQASNRLGSGDFSARAPQAGIAEVDAVAQALNSSAQRIGDLVELERRFSTDASHQLRTPLTGLRMRLEELAMTDDLDAVHEEAEAALTQVDRLASTITELLELRRKGRVGEQVDLDLDALVRQHARLWEVAFRKAGRRLEVRPGGSATVRGTPGAVGQALDVLLDNALQHGAGTVTITVEDQRVLVGDEGVGVAEERSRTLFEPPATGDERPVPGTSGRGNGIGLALARSLVESDGGRLELVRAKPAVFEIVFAEAVR